MNRTQCVLRLVALFICSAGLAHSWDVALSVKDRIEFYTNATKTATAHLDSQKITALAYDEVHNMLLYVDKQNESDTVCGYNISSLEYKCYVERNGRNIHGLAFDPVTEILFFTDTKERSINWISFNGSESNVHGNLLIKLEEGIPTDIAVDSCRGYIYWINSNLTTPTIERARFNGSEREVVIKDEIYKLNLHSLAIGQQTQKIYWITHKNTSISDIYSADLNGKNKIALIMLTFNSLHKEIPHPNTLAASKKSLYSVFWCSACGPDTPVRRYPKPTIQTLDHSPIFKVHTQIAGIAANYKISDQIQGIPDCKWLESQVPNNDLTNDSLEIAREIEEPFCDHGTKVDGQSICQCTPGYIGKRCDVSVCENYCVQGNCSLNEEGLPGCSCNAGYSGERCEVDVCRGYCVNNGTCFLNEEDDPVCECLDDYAGDRCDVTVCWNNGGCSLKESDAGCKVEKNNTVTSTYFSAVKNLTLGELFANWNKPVATVKVVVEVPQI